MKRLPISPSLLQAQLDVFTIAMASLLRNRGLFQTTCTARLRENHDLAQRKTLSGVPANGIGMILQRRGAIRRLTVCFSNRTQHNGLNPFINLLLAHQRRLI